MIKIRPSWLIPLLFIYLFSCQTNKAPRWIEDPPLDDDLHIYIVGIGEGDAVFDSVIDQLNSRFNIKENPYITDLLLTLMKDSFNNSPNADNDKLAIVDRWLNNDLTYILVRLNRDFFDPIIELYSTRYDEMIDYAHEDEIEADALLKDGELFSAANLYISALDYMLNQDDEFYSLSIISVMDKVLDILSRIKYYNVEVFELLKIAHPIGNSRLFIQYNSTEDENFSGFLYNVEFIEGWEIRSRKARIPIRENNLEFIPPQPKISGTFPIEARLNLESFINVVKPWIKRDGLSNYFDRYLNKIDQVIINSIVSFNYDVISEIQTLPNIIAFNNSNISEGIVRFILEKDGSIEVSPIIYGSESLLNYIREVNKITGDLYRYMILGGKIEEDRKEYEGGTLFILKGEISLVDLYSSTIIVTKEITSEFLSENGEENLVYLDFGLKIGEIIYNLKF